MPNPSPFSLLEGVFNDVASRFNPPDWAVDEIQGRIVLLLNHVLQQEREAMARLARQKGQVLLLQWRQFSLKLVATPAGLLDKAAPGAQPDLSLLVTEESPLAIAQATLRGDKPGVRIEGDVQLAAEVSWLVEHVRWDMEDDLARLIGDVPAHALGDAVRRGVALLRGFAGGGTAAPGPGGTSS
jgi:ubiquinone biosynthesis protein UbiJ